MRWIDNSIGDGGMQALAEELQTHSTLVDLHLGRAHSFPL
jgi:hypothetical protein